MQLSPYLFIVFDAERQTLDMNKEDKPSMQYSNF